MSTPLANSAPVTAIITEFVKPGLETQFEDWIKGVVEAAEQIPGHMGVEIIRPNEAKDSQYVIIFRYDNIEHLKAWENSTARAEWKLKVQPLLIKKETYQTFSGLEYWFKLPSQTTPPPAYKMASISWLAIFPLSYILSLLLQPLLHELVPIVRTMIISAILISLMTWLVMPFLTRLFAFWLFAKAK